MRQLELLVDDVRLSKHDRTYKLYSNPLAQSQILLMNNCAHLHQYDFLQISQFQLQLVLTWPPSQPHNHVKALSLMPGHQEADILLLGFFKGLQPEGFESLNTKNR